MRAGLFRAEQSKKIERLGFALSKTAAYATIHAEIESALRQGDLCIQFSKRPQTAASLRNFCDCGEPRSQFCALRAADRALI